MKDQVKKQIHHLIEKPVKQQLKQPRLLSGVTNKAEADTGDMVKIIKRSLKKDLSKLP